MEVKKTGECYSVFEETDDPMENMRRRNKIFVLVIFCVCFFALLGWEIVQTMPSKYKGIEEYYEVEGLQIPTLYKYTGYSDVFMVKEISNLTEGNMTASYVVIHYNNEIPEEYKNTYISEMKKIGYKKVIYQDTELYVKNTEDNKKFIYIYIGDFQAKFGVCVSGSYEDVLK